MALTGSEIEALQNALLDAFDPSTLEQMVRIGLDENLPTIAGGANFRDVTFNLIRWAERTGRVDDLLAAAMQANPDNPALLAIVAGTRPSTGGSQANVSTHHYDVAGDVYQINQVFGNTAIGRGARTGDSTFRTDDSS